MTCNHLLESSALETGCVCCARRVRSTLVPPPLRLRVRDERTDGALPFLFLCAFLLFVWVFKSGLDYGVQGCPCRLPTCTPALALPTSRRLRRLRRHRAPQSRAARARPRRCHLSPASTCALARRSNAPRSRSTRGGTTRSHRPRRRCRGRAKRVAWASTRAAKHR